MPRYSKKQENFIFYTEKLLEAIFYSLFIILNEYFHKIMNKYTNFIKFMNKIPL